MIAHHPQENNPATGQDDRAYAAEIIGRLLGGHDSGPPDPTRTNGLSDALAAAYESYQDGGAAALREAWPALCNTNPGLADLIHVRRAYTMTDLQALPSVEFLAPGKLVKNALNEMHGQPESGKSLVALNLIADVAREHGPVLYFMAEGQAGYGDRGRGWEKHHKEAFPANVFFDGDEFNLLDDLEVDTMITTYSALRPVLVVFDTLSWVFHGEENSSKDMADAMRQCRYIQKRMNCAVLLIHHTTKTGSSERGSSALRGACDSMIEVTNHDGFITVSSDKLKDGEKFETEHYRIISMPIGDDRTAPVLAPSDKVIDDPDAQLSPTETKVLEFLAQAIFEENGALSRQIIAALHLPDGTVYNTLSRLKKRGYIEQGNKREPYTITESGKGALSH